MDLQHFLRKLQRWLSYLGGILTRWISDAPTQSLDGILKKHARRATLAVEDWDDFTDQYKAQTVNAINSLEFLDPGIDAQVPLDANLVIVLVEKRLLMEEPNSLKQPHSEPTTPKDEFWKMPYIPGLSSAQTHPPQKPPSGLFNLRPSLQSLRADIGNTHCDFSPPDFPPNLTASIILVDLYAGDSHLDGKIILAIREFLRDAAKLYAKFRGVILVGAFPDALVKRIWGLKEMPKSEVLSFRSDIVLADLNGCWENLYIEKDDCFLLDDIIRKDLVFGIIPKIHPANQEVGEQDGFNNASFNKDVGQYQSTGLLFRVHLADAEEVKEEQVDAQGHKHLVQVNPGDIAYQNDQYVWKSTGKPTGKLLNQFDLGLNETGVYNVETPIVLPEILVSRIDARNIARTPVRVGACPKVWMPDPYLERHLLIEYFKRNHDYRVNEIQHRGCAGISAGSTDGSTWEPVDLRAAFCESQSKLGKIESETAVTFSRYPECTKDDFRKWLDETAIMRSMLLHGTVCELTLNDDAWLYTDFRDYWEQRKITKKNDSKASFYWNTSCWGNAPIYAGEKPYNACMYGYGTASESLLFLADGLAIIARGQKGDDWLGKYPDQRVQPSPPGGAFEVTLRARRTFGETWRAIFEGDRNNPTLRWGANEGVRKNAYRWGIIGDWTLRLNEWKP